jgi:hypothetical protein
VRCHGRNVGEHVGNLRNILRTWWNPLRSWRERSGNTLGTHWEARKNEKNPSPSLHPRPKNLKGKKARRLECMLGPSHWLHEFLFPKSSSPILAWATNTPCKEQPTYLFTCLKANKYSYTPTLKK